MKGKIIYLIGMPGCGKSTLGNELARQFNWEFVDLDHKIEELTHQSIPSIFENFGEDHFRKLEQKVLHENVVENSVVATGGGAPCFFDNMEFIQKTGFSIFLDISLDVLATRILDQKGTRPLAMDDDLESLKKNLSDKYQYRKKFYQQADLTLNENQLLLDQIVEKIHSVF